jgi:hypothetical protein
MEPEIFCTYHIHEIPTLYPNLSQMNLKDVLKHFSL